MRAGTRQAAEETVMEAIVYEEFGGPGSCAGPRSRTSTPDPGRSGWR